MTRGAALPMTPQAVALPALYSAALSAQPADRGLREEDREAVLRCQNGEREAFDRLVERYQREVYRH